MSNNTENLNSYDSELKRNANGVIDIEFYRQEAEAMRAMYIRQWTKNLLSGLRKRFSSVLISNTPHPAANIVGYQKLTLEV